MKKTINLITVLLLSNLAFAGKEGGGGSYARILQHAGMKVDDLLNPSYPKGNVGPLEVFIKDSEEFYSILEKSILSGKTTYQDKKGNSAQFYYSNLKDLKSLILSIKADPSKFIQIASSLGSLSTGEAVTAVNIPEQKLVILGMNSYTKIFGVEPPFERQTRIHFTGHELLSLLSIESGTSYAISADLLSNIFPPKVMTCKSYSGETMEYEVAEFEVHLKAIDFAWPASVSSSAVLSLPVNSPFRILLNEDIRYKSVVDMSFGYPNTNGTQQKFDGYFNQEEWGSRVDPTEIALTFDYLIPGPLETFKANRSMRFKCNP